VGFKVLTVVLVEDKFFSIVSCQGSITNITNCGGEREREIKKEREVWQL
jgi:hypothetical protein